MLTRALVILTLLVPAVAGWVGVRCVGCGPSGEVSACCANACVPGDDRSCGSCAVDAGPGGFCGAAGAQAKKAGCCGGAGSDRCEVAGEWCLACVCRCEPARGTPPVAPRRVFDDAPFKVAAVRPAPVVWGWARPWAVAARHGEGFPPAPRAAAARRARLCVWVT